MVKHQLTKVDNDIKKETAIITVLGMIISIVFDFAAFFLQLGKNEIVAGRTILGLVLIALYYMQRTVDNGINLWMDDIVETYREHYTTTIGNKVVEVLLKVRGRVWRKNEELNSKEMMSTNSILLSCKNYITLVWDLKTDLANDLFRAVSLVCMFIGFIVVTTFEIEHTTVFIAIILLVSGLSVLFSIKRNNVRNRYRKERKKYDEERDQSMTDVLSIEPVSNKHARYMASKFIQANKKLYEFKRKDRKGLNKVNFLESIVDAVATFVIIAMKVYETGIENVNIEVVLSIISLVTIYSQIMNRVNSMVHIVENYRDTFKKMETYESDFIEITRVLDSESNIDMEKGSVREVLVPEFRIQYQQTGAETPFSLVNDSKILLHPGDIALLTGPTGSGKSTFMKMVTRNLEFNGFELYYDREKNGFVRSLMHQTDGKLGYSSVLSEITLGEDVNETKLIDILKGLHLYEEISEKDEDVLRYLEKSKVQDYSTGQKQRLAIARLLYNVDEQTQIIGFDEATNALNDAITLQTLNFIKQYCPNKILLIATHQVDIGETVANKRFTFAPSGTFYRIEEI